MDNGPDGNQTALFARTYSTERLGALSDGLFAISMTLLVLELKIPEVPSGNEQELVADLVRQLPNFLAWIVSFVLASRFWMVHHALLEHLGRCNFATIIANFFVLGLISLIPFASGLIGTYEFDFVAIALFSLVMGLTGLTIGFLALHINRNQHLHREGGTVDARQHWRYHAIGIPLFAAFALGMAWVQHPSAALAVWIIEPFVALGLALRGAW